MHFFSACNFYITWLVFATNPLAALGFSVVGCAAAAGVLRFGFAPAIFTGANEHLAETAAFVGLPLVGLSTLIGNAANGLKSPLAAFLPAEKLPAVHTAIVALVIVHALLRGLAQNVAQFRIPFNFLLFIVPTSAVAFRSSGESIDYSLLAGIALILVSSVATGAERDSFLFGVRRENWFHYGMGIATVLVGRAVI